MWGCTVRNRAFNRSSKMVPTHVRVYRGLNLLEEKNQHGPHACGGVPKLKLFSSVILSWSPRMWGCTVFYQLVVNNDIMVPTHVGVYRS